jgi:hypothetical protein
VISKFSDLLAYWQAIIFISNAMCYLIFGRFFVPILFASADTEITTDTYQGCPCDGGGIQGF